MQYLQVRRKPCAKYIFNTSMSPYVLGQLDRKGGFLSCLALLIILAVLLRLLVCIVMKFAGVQIFVQYCILIVVPHPVLIMYFVSLYTIKLLQKIDIKGFDSDHCFQTRIYFCH